MSEISDAALVGALRRQMTIAVARQVAAGGNVANVNTPGYKAVEVSFASALDDSLGKMAMTHPRHLPVGAEGTQVVEKQGVVPRRDGNTVELDQEVLAMSRAAGDFSAAQTALAAKFRLVRYAISESK